METAPGSTIDRVPSSRVRSRGCRGRRLVKSEAGAALVELALVLLFFLLPLFLGMVALGRVFYYNIELKNAAAAGAEYGARSGTSYANITGMNQAATYEAQDITMTSGYPKADYRVCTDSAGAPAGCVTCTSPSSCVWPATPNSIFVDVYTQATINLFITNVPITLKGYGTMRAQ